MWYILEVEEFLADRAKGETKEDFFASISGVLGFLSQYENADGLLENLPSWNFVEWSDANTWTQNVNYPTNFLYSEALMAGYRLYGVAGSYFSLFGDNVYFICNYDHIPSSITISEHTVLDK
jgi:hypothetical protein